MSTAGVCLLACALFAGVAQAATYQFESAFGRPPAVGEPYGMTVDKTGTIYIADRVNGGVIKISQTTATRTVPPAMRGGYKRPAALTIDANGNLLIADEADGGMVFKGKPGTTGMKSWALNENSRGFGDSAPGGIATDSSGNVYVSDQIGSVIRKFSSDGRLLDTIGKRGDAPGSFLGPRGLSTDKQGNVYVADEFNNRIQKLDTSGRVISISDAEALGKTISGGLGPMSVAVDSKGNMWVAAHTNFAVYKLDPQYHILARIETFGKRDGEVAGPVAVSVDANDNVFVLDRTRRVQKFSPTGNFLWKYAFPPAKLGELSAPTGVRGDSQGNVYVSDTANFRIQKFDKSGKAVMTFGEFGQGPGQFNGAESIAIDRHGSLWIVDSYNHRVQKFDQNGKFLLSVGSFGRRDGEFIRTKVVETDPLQDIVYVNDWNNARVQKFDLNGKFLASFGDTGPPNTRVYGPTGLAVDRQGNVYVSSWFNNSVQKFDSSGKHLMSIGSEGSAQGQFKGPARLTIDKDGNLVVVDWGNQRVQIFDTEGRFLSMFGKSGRNDGEFDQPVGVTVDAAGNLIVSDASNGRINRFHAMGGVGEKKEPSKPQPVRKTSSLDEPGGVYTAVAIYDVIPGKAREFETAVRATRAAVTAETSFVNERILRNVDGLTLQYATYTKYRDPEAARRIDVLRAEALRKYCRRPAEVHVTKLTDAFTIDGITDKPTGTDFGGGNVGQIAHVGMFVPIPHYVDQYYDVLHETKTLTRARKPEGYIGEDLLVEVEPQPPELQTPYSPHPAEAERMSINYGEYKTMENAEDSYISRQQTHDPRLVTMERVFFSSLQVPTRFYIFQVFDNYGPAGNHAPATIVAGKSE